MGALRKGEKSRTEKWIEYFRDDYSKFNRKQAILELWEENSKSMLPLPSDSMVYEWESLTEEARSAVSFNCHYIDSGSKASAMKQLYVFFCLLTILVKIFLPKSGILYQLL